MARYIIKRLLIMIPIILGVIFVVYLISWLAPGDPILTMLGDNYTDEMYASLQHKYGLDQPFIVQYLNYIKNVFLHGDLGTSYSYQASVSAELLVRAPYTLTLGFSSVIFTIVVGVPIGVLSATKQHSAADYIITFIAMFFAGMPAFWFALMMMLLFSVQLGWLPATGYQSFKNWILPVLSLGLTTMATVIRMTRSSMLEVIRQDYVRTARAKGLSEGTVLTRHVLKNSLVPVVTVIGSELGSVVGGSIVIETIFNMPGIGSYLMRGISARDFPIINGCVIVLSFSVCFINMLVDVAYAYLDPQIKASYVAQNKHRKKKKAVAVEGEGGV